MAIKYKPLITIKEKTAIDSVVFQLLSIEANSIDTLKFQKDVDNRIYQNHQFIETASNPTIHSISYESLEGIL